VLYRSSHCKIMPILSRRSQLQYSRRQAGSGQSLNVERRKRHSNVVHPVKSAVESNNLSRISSVCRQGTTQSTLEHNRTQPPPFQSQGVCNITSLPNMNYRTNGSGSRSGSGSCAMPLCPVPPPSAPLTYYCRPAVVRRHLPANDRACERETLKRQQRLQVIKHCCKLTEVKSDCSFIIRQ